MPTPKLRHEPKAITMDEQKMRLLCYGEPGVGKTTLALSFPRPFVINTDDGLISGAIQGLGGIEYAPEGWREFEAIYWWAKAHSDAFDTVVIDSITTVQRLLMDELVEATYDKKGANSPVMEFVPEQATYLATQRQIGRILNDFRMLGKHMVVTAGVREKMGKKSADVSPGIFSVLSHWSSVIGQYVVVTKDAEGKTYDPPMRALLTAPSSDREAKSRFQSLTPYVANPTFDKVWTAVLGEYSEAAARNGKTQ
jgi:AAA domain-containing protein